MNAATLLALLERSPIPERYRTLVGSHPNRKPLNGREAVERALRFCRCRPMMRGNTPARDRAPQGGRDESSPPSRQAWLGLAAELRVDLLEALLGDSFVLHDGRLLRLDGDKLVSIELEHPRAE